MGQASWQSVLGKSAPTAHNVATLTTVNGRTLCRYTKSEPLVACDPSKMVVTAVLASPLIDTQGDFVDPRGVLTEEHELNPLVLYDHAIEYKLPIAKSVNADGRYSVRLSGDRLLGDAKFSAKDKFSAQLFRLVEDDMIRGWSVGFDPVEGAYDAIGPVSKSLGRSPMMFASWKLVEYSLTPRPVNPEALTILVEKGRVGSEAMHDLIRKSLTPFTITNRPVSLAVPPELANVVSGTVRKAAMDDQDTMYDDTSADGMDADQGMDAQPQTKPTVAALQDMAQGILDIVAQARMTLEQGEHMKGRKVFNTLSKQLEAIAKKATEAGDKIADELKDLTGDDDASEADDVAEADAPEMSTDDDGGIVTKSQYKPRRWTTADVGFASVQKSRSISALPDDFDDADDDEIEAEIQATRERIRESAQYLDLPEGF